MRWYSTQASETATSPKPTRKPSGLWQRVAKKLKPPVAATVSASPKLSAGPGIPGDFVSKENRQAALRARGLLPRDLSELEQELDQRYPTIVAPPPQEPNGEESAARKIQQDWLARNASDGDTGPGKIRYLFWNAR